MSLYQLHLPSCYFSERYGCINCILVSRKSCIFYICRFHSNAPYLWMISSTYNHKNSLFDSPLALESWFVGIQNDFEVSGHYICLYNEMKQKAWKIPVKNNVSQLLEKQSPQFFVFLKDFVLRRTGSMAIYLG